MRVLQALIDGGGNVAPQLAITRRLIERGHHVTVLGHRTLRARVEARGAEFVPFERTMPDIDFSDPEKDYVADWGARTPIGAAARFRDRGLIAPLRDSAAEALELLERQPADVAVVDFLLPGVLTAAQRKGIPAFALVHCPYPGPVPGVPPLGTGLRPGRNPATHARDRVLNMVCDRFYRPLLAEVNAVRREYGMPPLPSVRGMIGGADRVFALTVPELDFASRGELQESVRFAGPAFEPTAGEWQSAWPATNTDPLLLISFSTTYMDQRGFAERVLAAVAPLRVRALLTTGPALDVSGLEVPANARVVPFAPHSAVVPHAALVVTHAGYGTVQTALAAGVPVVCMPDGRDQPDVAARVVEAGVGLRVGRSAKPERLRETISRALADPALREAAMRMAEALRRRDGAATVVEEVERLGPTTSALAPSPAAAS